MTGYILYLKYDSYIMLPYHVNMSQYMSFCYLNGSDGLVIVKALMSLYVWAVSPEPLLLAYRKYS